MAEPAATGSVAMYDDRLVMCKTRVEMNDGTSAASRLELVDITNLRREGAEVAGRLKSIAQERAAVLQEVNQAKGDCRAKEEETWRLRGQVLHQRKDFARCCAEMKTAQQALAQTTRDSAEHKSRLATVSIERNSAVEERASLKQAVEQKSDELASTMADIKHLEGCLQHMERTAQVARERGAQIRGEPGLLGFLEAQRQLHEVQRELLLTQEERDRYAELARGATAAAANEKDAAMRGLAAEHAAVVEKMELSQALQQQEIGALKQQMAALAAEAAETLQLQVEREDALKAELDHKTRLAQSRRDSSQSAALNILSKGMNAQQGRAVKALLNRWRKRKLKHWQRVAARVFAVSCEATRRAEVQSKLRAWQCAMQADTMTQNPQSPVSFVGDVYYQAATESEIPSPVTQPMPVSVPSPEPLRVFTDPPPVSDDGDLADDVVDPLESVMLPLDMVTPEGQDGYVSDEVEDLDLLESVMLPLDAISPTTEEATGVTEFMDSVMLSLDQIAPETEPLIFDPVASVMISLNKVTPRAEEATEELPFSLVEPILGTILMKLDHIAPDVHEDDEDGSLPDDPLSSVMSSLDHISPHPVIDEDISGAALVEPILGTILMKLDHLAPDVHHDDDDDSLPDDPLSSVMSSLDHITPHPLVGEAGEYPILGTIMTSLDRIAPSIHHADDAGGRGSGWRGRLSHIQAEGMDESMDEVRQRVVGLSPFRTRDCEQEPKSPHAARIVGTAMHSACREGDKKKVKGILRELKKQSLIDECLSSKDSDGKTPLDLCIANGHSELHEYLVSKGSQDRNDDDNNSLPNDPLSSVMASLDHIAPHPVVGEHSGTRDSLDPPEQLPYEASTATDPFSNVLVTLDHIAPKPTTFPIQIEQVSADSPAQPPLGASQQEPKMQPPWLQNTTTSESEKLDIMSNVAQAARAKILKTMPPGMSS